MIFDEMPPPPFPSQKVLLLLGASGFPLCLQDTLHLLALSLSADVRSETLLGEFQASLVLGDLQQLQASLLVRSESGNLSDHLADEFDVFVLHTLSSRWLDGGFVFRHAKSFVADATDRHCVFRRHF